jgi:hypothetical protein
MNHATPAVQRYLDAWNETDPARRAARIAETWIASARYADPLATVEGAHAIDQLIGAVQAQFPAHRFEPYGGVDGHGANLRFAWALKSPSGDTAARGTDFAVLADDGRFAAVTGFLDLVPGGATVA